MQRMGKLNEQWPWVASVPLADIKLRFVCAMALLEQIPGSSLTFPGLSPALRALFSVRK